MASTVRCSVALLRSNCEVLQWKTIVIERWASFQNGDNRLIQLTICWVLNDVTVAGVITLVGRPHTSLGRVRVFTSLWLAFTCLQEGGGGNISLVECRMNCHNNIQRRKTIQTHTFRCILWPLTGFRSSLTPECMQARTVNVQTNESVQ